MIDDKPTEFRGVAWDDGWEFDMPCIVYYPIEKYGIGGNIGYIENMVEDYCIDLCIDSKPPKKKLGRFEKKEFRWRGWSIRGMSRRKNAWHVTVKVRWSTDPDGRPMFEIVEKKESYGRRESL